MQIQTLVTFSDDTAAYVKLNDNKLEILEVLGGEAAVAIQLRDLFDAVTEAMAGAVNQESELTVEVNASLTAKASGGVKAVIFNVGGDLANSNTMKIILKTKIVPNAK